MLSRRGLLAAGVARLLGGESDAPARVHRIRIGHSVRGRPLYAYRLGPAAARSRYLVLGCLHGDEPAGYDIARNRLLRREAPPGVQLWVVSTMNPDGLAAGRRTNARGVDLNRNFPSSDWRRQGRGTNTWSGPRPASEPETRAMLRFLRNLRPHTVVLMHQPLRCVDFSGGDPDVTRWLARHLDLPARVIGVSGGNLTQWFNETRRRHTAVTLELMQPVPRAYRIRVADVLVQHARHRRRAAGR